MPSNVAAAEAGLGTTIINALAKQLHATLHVEPGRPGAAVTVKQTKLRLIDGPACPVSDLQCVNDFA